MFVSKQNVNKKWELFKRTSNATYFNPSQAINIINISPIVLFLLHSLAIITPLEVNVYVPTNNNMLNNSALSS